jgi:hypothetical protein
MKTSGPFHIYKRQDTKKYHLTLYPASGLPPEVCRNWQRKGFSRLPLELAVFREPRTKAAADAGALALIEYLKNQIKQPEEVRQIPRADAGPRDEITVGAWLELTGKKALFSGNISIFCLLHCRLPSHPLLGLPLFGPSRSVYSPSIRAPFTVLWLLLTSCSGVSPSSYSPCGRT